MGEIKLMDYLKKAVELETSLFTQSQTIFAMDAKINSLGNPRLIQKPQRSNPDTPGGTLYVVMTCCPILVVGAMRVLFGREIAKKYDWPIDFVDFSTCVLIVLCIIFGILISVALVRKEERRVERYYQSQLQTYNQENAQDHQRVERELRQRAQLCEIRQRAYDTWVQTRATLDKFYAVDIIYPKYRSMIPVCAFYEYIMSGRCTELGGPNGAYNKYDNEVLLKIIVSKLDQVIQNLEEIKEAQWALYDAIQESNRTSKRILDASIRQTEAIEQNTRVNEVTAYYAGLTEENTRMSAWIDTIDLIYRK